MSKEANIYENIDGTEAFLAGVIEVLTENILGLSAHVELTSDVYGLGDNNELSIKQAIRKRIDKKCFDCLFDNDKVDMQKVYRSIESLIFEKQDEDIKTAFKRLIGIVAKDTDKLDDVITEYCRNLQYYMGKPINIYSVKDRNGLFNAYNYIIFGTLIIEFDEYALMVNIGTSD